MYVYVRVLRMSVGELTLLLLLLLILPRHDDFFFVFKLINHMILHIDRHICT